MLGAGIALDRALAGLLAGCGARAVRVVDGAGVVVAALPLSGGSTDDPATVARLVSEAVVLGRGGLDDVLVTTARAQHLLCPIAPGPIAPGPVVAPGAFLHLTADLDVDAALARRLLADPALHAAVAAALTRGHVARAPDGAPARSGHRWSTNGVPLAVVPAPRPAPVGANGTPAQPGRADVPFARTVAVRPVPDHTGELPALAGLAVSAGRTGDGARAVEALTRLVPAARPVPARPVPARPVPARPVPARPSPAPHGSALVPLPRRSPAAAPVASRATTGLPERSWAGDLDTMRRLLVGLRRLA